MSAGSQSAALRGLPQSDREAQRLYVELFQRFGDDCPAMSAIHSFAEQLSDRPSYMVSFDRIVQAILRERRAREREA